MAMSSIFVPKVRVFAIFIAIVIMPSIGKSYQGRHECIDQAARAVGVPTRLLYAIKQVETGDSWGQIVTLHDNGARDIGLWQVNEFWLVHLSSLGLDEGALMTVCGGAQAAALILAYEYRRAGSWKAAVGHYHSKDSVRQSEYVARVARALRDIPQGYTSARE